MNTAADSRLQEPETGRQVPFSLQGLFKGDESGVLHGHPTRCSYFSISFTKCLPCESNE